MTIHSGTGEDTSRLFAIRPSTLDGLSAVNGTGQIAANSSGKASWILVPTSEAAPDGPINHVVGGTLRYQQNGVLITIPLVPSSSINVLPNGSLSLKYFHQRDVFADDPFTDQIEPSIPYSLAVMIQNSGKGVARNLRISSAQPKIVENKKGLLIDFNIIATEVAGQSLTPSLTANFGDIAPGQIKIGRWLLKSTSEATGPSTNQFTIIVRDNGQPSLMSTGRVSVIVREVNSAPVLAGMTNHVLDELKTLRFQAQATDADLPANTLTFSLASPPAGASITASGLFCGRQIACKVQAPIRSRSR